MAVDQYPCIGYDPARGNVATLEQLAKELTETAEYAGEAREALASVKRNEDIWNGPAAAKFAENIEDLPGYLGDADESMRKAGAALEQWSGDLSRLKERAQRIEAELREALEKERQAQAEAQHANQQAVQAASHFGEGGGSMESAQRASQAAKDATAAVEELRRRAEALRDRWEDLSGECAKALREAADHAPEKGFWEGIGDMIAGSLETIADIAGIVSAIAGVLSFVPGLNAIAAPVAIISGASHWVPDWPTTQSTTSGRPPAGSPARSPTGLASFPVSTLLRRVPRPWTEPVGSWPTPETSSVQHGARWQKAARFSLRPRNSFQK
ncbi:hypothetical protein BJF85_12570 [Saccharomonospora sp. CUA-673]|uniref:putative T7SS-secreted protein n=1 Tax=Saccharomonospora sp. CUA-673 TaxID=1904969 RepID=UPI000968CC47|nr:hypothetical protein [Saccharomonospora sp. CUA-673]OLT48363.1 hypothetical protein BJF85_12570 [Saccharomonospora sp. CUA-673]